MSEGRRHVLFVICQMPGFVNIAIVEKRGLTVAKGTKRVRSLPAK
jgi:hypothetical protein